MELEKQWQCPNCKEVHEDVMELCWKCGTDREGNHSDSFQCVTSGSMAVEEVQEQWSTMLKKLAGKQRFLYFWFFVLMLAFVILGLGMKKDIPLLGYISVAVSALSIVGIFYLKLTMGIYYCCPKCGNNLTMDSHSKSALPIKLPYLKHCHHCGVLLVKEIES